MTTKSRPTGVTILAILDILGGIIFLLGAVFIGVLFPALGGLLTGFGAVAAAMGAVISLILIICAVFSFVIAYGLWTGKGWAWTLSFIFSVITIVLDLALLPGGIIGIILNVIILYYLTRPHVKEFFGKVVPPPPPPPPPP